MKTIDTIADLEALYGAVVARSMTKVTPRITPLYAEWINASRFCVVTTIGPDGTDGSPRGDDGPVVQIADDKTILLPDWRGNNRLDTLRNIVSDGRISLMFMIAGSKNVVRVNGTAVLSVDPAHTHLFDQRGTHPKSVVVVSVGEVYFQCAKALMRSELWSVQQDTADLPSAGDFLKEQEAEFDGSTYDLTYEDSAKGKMW